jgi:tryptophan 2,3-dioxygenase
VYQATTDEPLKVHLLNECQKKKELFDSIFDVDIHNALVARGERRFSHKALQVCEHF